MWLLVVAFTTLALVGVFGSTSRHQIAADAAPSVVLCWGAFWLPWARGKGNDELRPSQGAQSQLEQREREFEFMKRELRRRIFNLHSIFEVSVDLARVRKAEDLMQLFIPSLIGQIRATSAVAYVKEDRRADTLRLTYCRGMNEEDLLPGHVPLDDAWVAQLQTATSPVQMSQLNLQPDHPETVGVFGVEEIHLLVPMIHSGFMMGLVALGPKTDNSDYTQAELEMVSLMTNFASVSLSNSLLFEELEQISITDGLTGLYNRRYFQRQIRFELARARRFSQPLSLVIMDVDHFKRLNDTLGHPAGDQVLKEMGQILRQTIRASDSVFRYGGEEFCVILPNEDVDGARALAERLRHRISKHSFLERENQPGRRVNVSLGTASFPRDAMQSDELVLRADQALYAGKEGGRNRTVTFSEMNVQSHPATVSAHGHHVPAQLPEAV